MKGNSMNKSKPAIALLCGIGIIISCIVSTGCKSTVRTRKVKESGFMDDYSILKRTKGDKAQLLYVNWDTDWNSYSKVYIEPITVWNTEGSPLEKVSEEEIEMLATIFYDALSKELSNEYEVVDGPGPNTLQIRLALTEAKKSNVPMHIVSTVMPIGMGISFAKRMATGTHSFVGKMAAEMEIRDAETDKLVVAAVAARVGEKMVISSEKMRRWGDVQTIANAWAKRMHERTIQARNGTLREELEL